MLHVAWEMGPWQHYWRAIQRETLAQGTSFSPTGGRFTIVYVVQVRQLGSNVRVQGTTCLARCGYYYSDHMFDILPTGCIVHPASAPMRS